MKYMLLIFLVALLLAPVSVVADFSDKRLELAEEELERQEEVKEWMRESNATHKAYMRRYYTPIIKANRSDYDRNMKLARRYRDRANDTDNEDRRRRYQQLAKLFREYAQKNRAIVEAIRDGEGEKLDEAFSRIKKIEEGIEDITGNNYEREWFTPEELRKAARELRRRERGEERED